MKDDVIHHFWMRHTSYFYGILRRFESLFGQYNNSAGARAAQSVEVPVIACSRYQVLCSDLVPKPTKITTCLPLLITYNTSLM